MTVASLAERVAAATTPTAYTFLMVAFKMGGDLSANTAASIVITNVGAAKATRTITLQETHTVTRTQFANRFAHNFNLANDPDLKVVMGADGDTVNTGGFLNILVQHMDDVTPTLSFTGSSIAVAGPVITKKPQDMSFAPAMTAYLQNLENVVTALEGEIEDLQAEIDAEIVALGSIEPGGVTVTEGTVTPSLTASQLTAAAMTGVLARVLSQGATSPPAKPVSVKPT